MWGIELAFFFGSVDRELLQKIFIDTTNEVFFLTKSLVTDFGDFIHNLLHVVGTEVTLSERAFDETAF